MTQQRSVASRKYAGHPPPFAPDPPRPNDIHTPMHLVQVGVAKPLKYRVPA
jgi:hypothetical protein